MRLLVDDGHPDAVTRNVLARLARREQSWLVQMTVASALRRVPPGSRWPIAVRLGEVIRGTPDANLERMLWYAIEPEVAAEPERAMQAVAWQTPRIRNWIARRLTVESGAATLPLVARLGAATDVGLLVDLLEGFNAGLPNADVTGLPAETAQMLELSLIHI